MSPLSPAHRRLLLWSSTISLPMLALLACTGGSDTTVSQGDAVVAPVDGSSGEIPDPSAIPLALDNLMPQFTAMGPAGVAPGGLTIAFARPVVAIDQVGTAVTEVPALEPALEGRWQWASQDRLSFTPETGFAPGTTYDVKLLKLQTREGTLDFGGAGPQWTTQVPEFGALRLEVFKSKGIPEVDVVFSGAIDESTLQAAKPAFNHRGKAVSARLVAVVGNRARYAVTVPAEAGDPTLTVSLGNGVKSLVSAARAPQTELATRLDLVAKPMRIYGSRLVEGGEGWYVEVTCDDDAVVGGYDRWWWDSAESTSRELSWRCIPSKEALSYVTVSPASARLELVPGENGFRISGDFARGPLTVRMAAGAPTIDGGVLESTFEETFEIGALKPSVGFTQKGRYLPVSGWSQVGYRHRNTEEVKVQIRHVPPQNLVFWMSGSAETVDERTATIVVDEVFPVTGPADQSVDAVLDLSKFITTPQPGLYEVTVLGGRVKKGAQRTIQSRSDTGTRAPEVVVEDEDTWTTLDRSRVLVTDLNLVVKREQGDEAHPFGQRLHLWTLAMETGDAEYGVDIELIKPSGAAMASCRTDLTGGCVLELPEKGLDPAGPLAVVARKGDDLTYLKFSDLQMDLSEEDVSGEPWKTDLAYRSAPYADRGVYRPGDVAHIAAIVREESNEAPKEGLPVVARLYDPRNRMVRRTALTTNAAGLVSVDVPFDDYAPTGSWRIHFEVGEKSIGSLALQVEEFVPERMKVTATGSTTGFHLGEDVPVKVEARYLFGGSAEGSDVSVDCSLAPTAFLPGGRKDFVWGQLAVDLEDAPRPVTLGTVSGEIEADGTTEINCPPFDGRYGQAAQLVAQVAVFEAGSGRSTQENVRVPVHPEDYYLGLKTGTDRLGVGESVVVSGAVVDWAGKDYAKLGEVEVEFFRLQTRWGWGWDPERNEERYTRTLRSMSEGTQKIAVQNGKFEYKTTPTQDAEGYLVRVKAGNARTDLRIEGKGRYYWWSANESRVDSTPRPTKATTLKLEVPEAVALHERAEVKFYAPYPGRVLMAVEDKAIRRTEWVDIPQAGPFTWGFKVDEFQPNVYVSAFLVKDPHQESKAAYLPDRAMGVVPVRVKPDDYAFAPVLKAPAEVRSNAPLVIDVEVPGAGSEPAWVTVAAVDEGILQLTDFNTPDPLKLLFPRKSLGVSTFETVGWSLMTPAAGNSSTTGGDSGGPGGRAQPVKPVSLWSGLVPLQGGKAKITFEVPQYRGALRVMAVASSGKRSGSAEAEVLVRDPLVLQTTLPRFLTHGDEIEIPVFVTNMSGKRRDVTVALTADGLPVGGAVVSPKGVPTISFTGAKEATFSLDDQASRTVVFRAKADGIVGTAKFAVVAKSGEIVSKEDLVVPFQPAAPRTRKVERVALTAGAFDLKPSLDGWLPSTEQSTIWVTPNPYGEALGHLDYLVHYPYGCIEQTSSATRPLLYVSNLLPVGSAETAEPGKVDDMIRSGIERLLSMQTPSGGFGYWPGDSEPIGWGTAYVTHLLIDAKELGHDVPEENLKQALDWLEDEVQAGVGGRHRWHGFRDSEAYFHYVLARSGRGKAARVQALIAELPKKLSEEQVEEAYLLKASLFLTGDRRYEAELRNPKVDNAPVFRKNGWSYWSNVRTYGLILSIHEDLFQTGVDEDGEAVAKKVYSDLLGKESHWYTTQELVWGVTGLGKRVAGQKAGQKLPNLLLNGKEVAPLNKANPGDRLWSVARASEYDRVELGGGEVPKGKLFALISSEGVPTNAQWRLGSSGLSVTRSWKTTAGETIAPENISLGQLVYVDVTVKNLTKDTQQNLALVDRIPAGWEIENPRLGRSGGGVEWIDPYGQWDAEHMNLRDDRLEVFGKLESGEERHVTYAVRAVTAGTFTAPPVQLEAMYDPSLWAAAPGGKIKIDGNWTAFYL